MTKFEQVLQQFRNGELRTPSVSMGNKKIDYFGYQLATHRYNLKILSLGLKFKGIKLKDLKDYYGLKGKTAAECIPEFEKIMADYKAELDKPTIQEILN
jgi:hypothetical protein